MRLLITIALIFTFSGLQSCSANTENTLQADSLLAAEPIKDRHQTDWKTQDDPLYTLDYPASWESNYTGQQGISFIAISSQNPNSDKFRDNVTLVVQDLKGKNLDLKQFADENTKEIRDEILDSKLIDKEGETNGAGKYREETFTGQQGSFKLIYTQRFYVHNGNSFILSFISQQDENNSSLSPIGAKILNSLQLK